MFGNLELEIKRVREVDLDAVGDEELRERTVGLARLRSQLEAVEAETLAAYDRRRGWAADGAKSAAADLAHRTRQSKLECQSRLATARAMKRLPVAAEAWLAGDVTRDHMRVLARAGTARTEALLARDESMLVQQASSLSFAKWSKAIDYWSQHADPDGTSDAELARRERRHVSVVELPDGVALSGLLDPIGGSIVAAELWRIEQELFDADRAEAKARLGRDPMPSELGRTPAQRRADALVEMARRSAGSKGRARPLFTVLLGADTFSQLCELEWSGQVVAPSALQAWAADAVLEGVLFERGTREITVSRKRTFTGALRRLLEVRDRECFHPTCEEPAPRCQGDHVEPWGVGGWTSPDNGRLACGHHNRLRHRRGPPPPEP